MQTTKRTKDTKCTKQNDQETMYFVGS
jgi:hypothetical protein